MVIPLKNLIFGSLGTFVWGCFVWGLFGPNFGQILTDVDAAIALLHVFDAFF